MAMELMAALVAPQRRLHLGELERGVLDERDFLFDDVEAEPHMVAAVAGERVETDFDGFDAFGALRGGLFLNGVNDGADKMDFVHK